MTLEEYIKGLQTLVNENPEKYKTNIEFYRLGESMETLKLSGGKV